MPVDLGRVGVVEQRPQAHVVARTGATASSRLRRMTASSARVGYLGVVPHANCATIPPGRRGSAGLEQHAEVERRRRVGERADRDHLDPGRGDLGDVRERDPARRLERRRASPAASRAPPPRAARSGSMLSSSSRSAPAASASATSARSRHSTSTASSGWAAAASSTARAQAAGERDVVLLDQDRVVEAHAVVAPAAGGDRRLLQRAQARASSCGCRGSSRRVPRDRVDVSARSAWRCPRGGRAG